MIPFEFRAGWSCREILASLGSLLLGGCLPPAVFESRDLSDFETFSYQYLSVCEACEEPHCPAMVVIHHTDTDAYRLEHFGANYELAQWIQSNRTVRKWKAQLCQLGILTIALRIAFRVVN